jgi:hypothetical protein
MKFTWLKASILATGLVSILALAEIATPGDRLVTAHRMSQMTLKAGEAPSSIEALTSDLTSPAPTSPAVATPLLPPGHTSEAAGHIERAAPFRELPIHAPPYQGQQGFPEGFRPPDDLYGVPALGRNSGHQRDFYFTRAIYSGYGYRRMGSWAIDFPKADRQFLWGLRRLTNIDAYEAENAVRLTDSNLRRFPFLYALEVGRMSLTEEEVDSLRSYLLAGGFLMIDDFWGSYEWQNFEHEIRRVLPEYSIVELPLSHPLFSTFYVIDEIVQVPAVSYAWYGGVTWERDGYEPHVRGIFDDDGRLMVVINWNTDLGDAWEWAEDPYYPLPFSTFAYQLAVNTIVYALSH